MSKTRKKYSNGEIIDELQKYKEEVGETPTYREFDSYSEISSETVINYFDSWNEALREADLKINNYKASKEELIEEMGRVSKECCDGERPTYLDIREYSEYPESQYEKYGWSNIIRECGFHNQYIHITNQSLKEDIKRVSEVHCDGSKPTIRDIIQYGEYSAPTYINRFGGWNSIMKEMGFEPYTVPTGREHPSWEGGYKGCYGPSWRKQRREAWERDDYECQICGEGRDEVGRRPDVHHIVPVRYWKIGKEHKTMNSLDNLICLCRNCHSRYGREENLFKNTEKTFVSEVMNYE